MCAGNDSARISPVIPIAYWLSYNYNYVGWISSWIPICQMVFFQECYPRDMKRVGYLFSKSWRNSAFLGVSASELKNLSILASNSKNSQSSDVVKMTNAKNHFCDKKFGFEGVLGVEIFDITLKWKRLQIFSDLT